MIDTGHKLVIFCKYCPKRQHNPETWIDDVNGSNIDKVAISQ